MSALFTSAVLQGLNAVGFMHSHNKSLRGVCDVFPLRCVGEIDRACGATSLVMQRTLCKLASAGIITVKRGPGGGFSITEEQLKTKTVLDVMDALGQSLISPDGNRASDKAQQRVYDALNLTLDEFFKN